MATKLDTNQIFKRAFDEATSSLKTVPGSNTSFSIELDAADGDSVTTYARQLAVKQTAVDNTVSSVVVAPFSVEGIKQINVHTNTTATITGAQVLTLQYSPHASDNIWINTSITLTPSGTASTVVSGTQLNTLNAVRCRLTTAAAITSGTYDVYITGN